MDKIISVLTNNIVVIWIAPIITGIVVAVLIKVFSIKKTRKEIKRANQEYKETILPYVLQMIILDEKVIHGIRDAICIELSVPKKYMYSDVDLMDVLIFDIVRTRYSTEEQKTALIEHICKMFSFIESNLVDTEKSEENVSNKFSPFWGTIIGIVCIVGVVAIYAIKPQALEDTNGTATTIVILLMAMSMVCFTTVFTMKPKPSG